MIKDLLPGPSPVVSAFSSRHVQLSACPALVAIRALTPAAVF
jgi:hypothetical protein